MIERAKSIVSHPCLFCPIVLCSLNGAPAVAEDYDYVKKYLREMAPLENSSCIQGWSTGGKVFLDYITMVDTIDEIKQVRCAKICPMSSCMCECPDCARCERGILMFDGAYRARSGSTSWRSCSRR